MTQKDRVFEILKREGVIDNVWAFNNQILRLGAIIHDLRREGKEIRTEYKNEKGLKNCHYYLINREDYTHKNKEARNKQTSNADLFGGGYNKY